MRTQVKFFAYFAMVLLLAGGLSSVAMAASDTSDKMMKAGNGIRDRKMLKDCTDCLNTQAGCIDGTHNMTRDMTRDMLKSKTQNMTCDATCDGTCLNDKVSSKNRSGEMKGSRNMQNSNDLCNVMSMKQNGKV